jgi:N6-L-threonylcarbamoyladenine synthase
LMQDHFRFEHIGQTLDDSIGEAFDKVGRTLGFGFPAGHVIEKKALLGNEKAFNFPRPLSTTHDYNWSYSGLKTAVLYQVKKLTGDYHSKPGKGTYKLEDSTSKLSEETINDIAASFQRAAVDALIIKLKKAIREVKPKLFIVGGGVIANTLLRNELEKLALENKVTITYPTPMWLCTDNAAMIAVTAYYMNQILDEKAYHNDLESLDRAPNLEIF